MSRLSGDILACSSPSPRPFARAFRLEERCDAKEDKEISAEVHTVPEVGSDGSEANLCKCKGLVLSKRPQALTGRRGECGYDNAPATVLREQTPEVNSLFAVLSLVTSFLSGQLDRRIRRQRACIAPYPFSSPRNVPRGIYPHR